MSKKDPRIDAYIAAANGFARPILKHLRKLVHAGCPGVEETMKWSFPHFMHEGILCGMAAFKQHCAFNFWKGDLVVGGDAAAANGADNAMGQFGRITSLADLPPDKAIISWVRKAAELNSTGTKKAPTAKAKPRKDLPAPDDLRAALKSNPKARETFENLSPSHKREYVEWITEAKKEATRQRRLQTTIEWLSKGKARNWKYERC
jgi:uncharacterized protein YdeI (YjbR/CyaY-like superfamily)